MESGKVGPKSEYGMNTELFFFEYDQIPNRTIRSQLFEYQIVAQIKYNKYLSKKINYVNFLI